MAIFGPLISATVFMGGVDLSGNCNKLDGPHAMIADEDVTNFASGGAKVRTGGLIDGDLGIEGFVEYGTGLEDAAAFSTFSANTPTVSVSADGTDGGVTYTMQALQLDYKFGGPVGGVQPYTISVKNRGQYGPVRGNLLLPKQTMTATTNGTVTNLGAVSSTQSLYAALHVFAASGTLDVTVQSAATVGFGSPTTRLTFSQMTATGDQFATPISGAITDGYWRVVATIAGGTPSFSAAVIVGIQ